LFTDKISLLKNKLRKNSILNNIFIIFLGDSFVSLIGLLTTYLAVLSIGLNGIGIITVSQTYSNIFNQIFNFQSFHATIKYFTSSLEKNDTNAAKSYIKQGFLLDVLTSLLAFIIGYLFLNLIAKFFLWNNDLIFYIKLFLIANFFNIIGSAQAIIRIFNKFNYFVYLNISIAIIKCGSYFVGFTLDFDLDYFVYIEVILLIFYYLILVGFSLKILVSNKLIDFIQSKLKIEKNFFMFNLYNNLVSTIDLPVGYLTTLFINKYLGISEVGLYNILQKSGNLLLKISQPINVVLYPEFSKLIAKNQFARAMRISNKIFIYISLIGVAFISLITIFYFLDKEFHIIKINLNKDYIYFVFIAYFTYIAMTSAVTSLHQLFIAQGYVKLNLPIVLIANSLYLITLYYLRYEINLVFLIMLLLLQVIIVAFPKFVILKSNLFINKKL
jgi:O-antigen/teichoic acid export membrane protein